MLGTPTLIHGTRELPIFKLIRASEDADFLTCPICGNPIQLHLNPMKCSNLLQEKIYAR